MIIEIVELGESQSLIQRQNSPTTELVKNDILVKELNEQLRLFNVTEQLPCKHEHIESSDGCDECIDCGARNF